MRKSRLLGLGVTACAASALTLTATPSYAHTNHWSDRGESTVGHERPRADDDHARLQHCPQSRRIELTTDNVYEFSDVQPSGPRAGDTRGSTGYLLKGGVRVGRFGDQGTWLMADGEEETLLSQAAWEINEIGTLMSQHLTVQSGAPGPRRWVNVITGGDGCFLGATGTIVVEKESEDAPSDLVTIRLADASGPDWRR
ncbi:hypothetical protein QTQ03_06630 [Micromonospora sp. WMMA1363]|uniref:hypothetical protein n=1 Tax=Micromonospora sp. WMMA1363 TaxID=3053985 RepID=UPI00259C8914|nr:hypothetical protein [Micromonospora sp. WMMA1363]MDM4719288.1 hypothetical protein [Micromonospora sp. WMMA1363]